MLFSISKTNDTIMLSFFVDIKEVCEGVINHEKRRRKSNLL